MRLGHVSRQETSLHKTKINVDRKENDEGRDLPVR